MSARLLLSYLIVESLVSSHQTTTNDRQATTNEQATTNDQADLGAVGVELNGSEREGGRSY